MRAWKWLRWVLLAVFLIVGGLVGLLAWTFSGTQEIPEKTAVEGFAQFVKDGFVAAFVLDLGDGKVALVDNGKSADGAPVLAELKARGLGPDDVSAILITHGHGDHTAACKLFPKAKVYAARAEVPVVEGKAASGGLLAKVFGPKDVGCRVTDPVDDGAKFVLGKREAEAFVIPGHTAGSTAWLVSGVLFLGDSADATKDRKLAPAKWLFSEDPARNRASLIALAGRLEPRRTEVRFLVFAHSGMLPGLDALAEFAKSGR